MKRKITFANNEFYHIFNRGAHKQPIFLDDKDYLRFVHNLYEMNDKNPTLDYRISGGSSSVVSVESSGGTSSGNSVTSLKKARHPIVEVIAWCLMPNHFHLMVRQKLEGAITSFMRKLSTGYAMYFNKKNERDGCLFQGYFKAILVSNDAQFLHLSRYIHLNPVDLIESGWKEQGIKDKEKAHDFLENYRWSSYPDWLGKKNFPSLLDRSGVEGMFKSAEDYKQFLLAWLAPDHAAVKSITLE